MAQPQIINPQGMQQVLGQGAQIVQTPDGQMILYQQAAPVQTPAINQVILSCT